MMAQPNEQQPTKRVIEHIGDAVVLLTARLIVHEKIGDCPLYFAMPIGHLVSNENLASAGYPNGDAAEIVIGKVCLDYGPDKAVEFARRLLAKTTVYKKLWPSRKASK